MVLSCCAKGLMVRFAGSAGSKRSMNERKGVFILERESRRVLISRNQRLMALM